VGIAHKSEAACIMPSNLNFACHVILFGLDLDIIESGSDPDVLDKMYVARMTRPGYNTDMHLSRKVIQSLCNTATIHCKWPQYSVCILPAVQSFSFVILLTSHSSNS